MSETESKIIVTKNLVEMVRSIPPSFIGIGASMMILMVIGYSVSALEVLVGPLIQYQGQY